MPSQDEPSEKNFSSLLRSPRQPHAAAPPPQFESIRSECASLRGALRRERSTTAENRLGSYLAATGATRRAFASPLAAARVRSATGDGALSLSSFPLEFRVYPVSAAMAWHRDEQLFSEPQVEAVLTLSNTSDSETEWLDAAGVLHSVWTEPNSLLLVRAAGGLHRVRAVARGERSIVKAAFCDAAATRLPSYDANLTTYIA